MDEVEETGIPTKVQAATAENGYLYSQGYSIWEHKPEQHAHEWLQADIRALGVSGGSDSETYYDVEILRAAPRTNVRAILPGHALTHPTRTAEWLARFRLALPPGQNPGSRIMQYLEAQDPPSFQFVEAMGGDPFATFQGAIDAEGIHPTGEVRPYTNLADFKYYYGMGELEETRKILRELLTFHHSGVASVFGSWMMAALLRYELHKRLSQFPIMVIESPSETGKSQGFFRLMIQLSGNKGGPILATQPTFRDACSCGWSQIVWMDDPSDVSQYYENLRAATVGATLTKMGANNTTTARFRQIAPIVLSGEHFGFGDEKAMVDRTIVLKPRSPTKRPGRYGRAQWEDVVRFMDRYPDLTHFAGSLVQLVKQSRDCLDEISGLRRTTAGTGRHQDKLLAVRVGSLVLADITGELDHILNVDEWAAMEWDPVQQNRLTTLLIPDALRHFDWPIKPRRDVRLGMTPVWIDEEDGQEIVQVNIPALADWLKSTHRLEKMQSLTDQADAAGAAQSVQSKIGLGTPVRWRAFSVELSYEMLEKSRGG